MLIERFNVTKLINASYLMWSIVYMDQHQPVVTNQYPVKTRCSANIYLMLAASKMVDCTSNNSTLGNVLCHTCQEIYS